MQPFLVPPSLVQPFVSPQYEGSNWSVGPFGPTHGDPSNVASTSNVEQLTTITQVYGSIKIPVTIYARPHRPDLPHDSEFGMQLFVERYGLNHNARDATGRPAPPALTRNNVDRMLGLHAVNDPMPPEAAEAADLACRYLAVGQKPPEMTLFDTSGYVRLHPFETGGRYFRVERLPHNQYMVDLEHPANKFDTMWCFVLDDPTTVLYMMRSVGRHEAPAQSKSELAKEMIDKGMSFHTAVFVIEPSSSPENTSLSLGVYPQFYRPTPEDYYVYEVMRDQILRGPRGRAAILKGGIVWRLTIELSAALNAVVGPTTNDRRNEYSVPYKNGFLVDDDLSKDELDVICGVYHVVNRECLYSGMFLMKSNIGASSDDVNHLSGRADFSWWPRHDIWTNSSWDHGYWTKRNEDWFQDRLRKIRAGEARVESGNSWRKILRSNNRWSHAREVLKDMAKQYVVNTVTA